jgi:hypothetical protein
LKQKKKQPKPTMSKTITHLSLAAHSTQLRLVDLKDARSTVSEIVPYSIRTHRSAEESIPSSPSPASTTPEVLDDVVHPFIGHCLTIRWCKSEAGTSEADDDRLPSSSG